MCKYFAYPCLLATVIAVSGCREEAVSEDEENRPSSISGHVFLSEPAQRTAGIVTSPAKQEKIAEMLTSVGWLEVPPGRDFTLKAPATGFCNLHELRIGDSVLTGQEFAVLRVFLSPQEEAQIVAAKEEADILMQQAEVTIQLAQKQLDRVREIPGVVAGTRVLELTEAVERARVARREAEEKLLFLPEEPYDVPLRLKPIKLKSPSAGRLADRHVTSGQLVFAGEPLVTVLDWSQLWVRVPLFVNERIPADTTAKIKVRGKEYRASLINVPIPAEAGRRTVDHFFTLDNSDGALRAGQPVRVNIPRVLQRQVVVIPQTAVLWDGWGEAWVYVRRGKTTFARTRIAIHSSSDNKYVVETGLKAGNEVVTQGVSALHAEQFKGQIQVDEDDD